MRRIDREVKDFNEIINMIDDCDTCRIAIYDKDYPYIVPLNFGKEIIDDTLYFYFHSAKNGRKLDLLKQNNKVAFELDSKHRIDLLEDTMDCTMRYICVMGEGDIEFIDDEQLKYHGLKLIMKQYHHEDFAFNTKMIQVTTVFRLKVKKISGKRNIVQ